MYRVGDKLLEWLFEEGEKMYQGIVGTSNLGGGGGIDTFTSVRSQQMELWKYAMGLQWKVRYKNSPKTAENDEELLPTSNGRNFKMLNHLLATMMGTLGKQELEVSAARIDSFAHEFRMDYANFLRTATLMKNIDEKATEAAQVIGLNPDEIPTNQEQLKARLSTPPQIADERDLKVAIKAIVYNTEMPAAFRQYTLALLIFGWGGIRVDNSGLRKEIRCFNPVNTRTSWSSRDDMSDIVYFNEVILVPLSKLKAEAAGQIEDWSAVEKVSVTYAQLLQEQGYGFEMLGAYDSEFEGDKFVQVLDFEFKKTHLFTIKKKPRGLGLNEYFLGFDETGKSKIFEKPIEVRYGGKIVLGLNNVGYNMGRIAPEARAPLPLAEEDEGLQDYAVTHLGGYFYKPMSFMGVNSGPTDKAMDVIDDLQELVNKAKNITKSITPPIIAYDLQAFLEVATTPGLKGYTIKRQLQQMARHGRVIYNGKARKSMPNAGSSWPVQIIPNDVSNMLKGVDDAIERKIAMLRNILGIPETLDGIIPGTRTAKGAIENANTAATNSMDPYFDARKSVFERVCRHLAYIVQCEGYNGAYGSERVKVDPAIAKWNIYNITTEVKPTQEQWNVLLQGAIQGWVKGQIPYSMVMMIQQETDLLTAQMKFSDWEERTRTQQAKADEKNIMMQDEVSANSAKRATDGKLAEIQEKMNGEIAKVQAQGQEERKALAAEIMAQTAIKSAEFMQEIKVLMIEHKNELAEIAATPKPSTAAA